MRAAGFGWTLGVALLACGGGDDAGGPDAGPDSGPAPVLATLTLRTSLGGAPAPLPWVALSDGYEQWQTVTSEDGVYTLELTERRWGIAYACDGATLDEMVVINGTIDDLTELTRGCAGGQTPDTGQLTLAFTGLDGDGAAIIGFGNGSSLATMASPSATQDLPAGHWDAPYTVKPDNADIARFGIASSDLAAGATVSVPVDATASTTAVVNHTATVIDPLGADVAVDASFVSGGGSTVSLRQPVAGTYATVPVEVLRDGDLHRVRASAPGSEEYTTRSAQAYFSAGADVTLELPATFVTRLVTAFDPTQGVRAEVSFDELPGAQLYSFEATLATTHRLRWIVTSAWLGDGDSHHWTQPEFSDLDGFYDGWYFPTYEDPVAFRHDAIATTGESFPLDYLEGSVDTPWFVGTGPWDGDVVTVSSFAYSETPE